MYDRPAGFVSLLILAILLAGCTSAGNARRLNDSPRHHEWVNVSYEGRTVRCWVVYPQVAARAPAVLVIHENRGLNDWARSVADRLAEEGFVAVAPDLLSGTGPNGGGTEDFADSDAARNGIYALPSEQVVADMQAVAGYARKIPSADGSLSVVGFCWGGSRSFHMATYDPDLRAAYVFYGTAPEDASLFAGVECPVLGFYGGNDNRVNATLEATESGMKSASKSFEPVTYKGAGHAFMRRAEDPDTEPANVKAADAAWTRLLEHLRAD